MKRKTSTLHTEFDPRSFRRLVRSGADVNAINEYGDTPLLRHVRVDFIRMLIAAGANVKYAARTGDTALHLAFYPAAVFELLRAGADPNARNAKHELPEDHWGSSESASVMRRMLEEVRRNGRLRHNDWRTYQKKPNKTPQTTTESSAPGRV